MSHRLTLSALALAAALPAALPAAQAQPPRVSKDAPARPATRPAPARQPAARPAARPAPAAPTAKAMADALASADTAFARQAAASGLRDAMLATLATDAVLFRPSAVRGRAWMEANSAPTGTYTWAPSWIATSAAAELGVTTGPLAIRGAAPDTSITGQYVSVWTRAGGPWKIQLHLVVPGPAVSEEVFSTHTPTGDGRPRGGPGAGEASRATLFIADRGFAAASNREGPAAALIRIAAPDIRVLRAGARPLVGLDSVRQGLAAIDERPGARLVWQTAGDLYMARSGDMGATYGLYERHDASGGVLEQGNFVRVWERQPDGGWRILLDASAPNSAR